MSGLHERLRALGVSLTADPQLPACEDVLFEPPCDVAAEIGAFQPLRIGAFTHLNGGYVKNAVIGRYCSMARDVQIGHGRHPVDWLSVSPLQYGAGYRGWSQWSAREGDIAEVETRPFQPFALTRIGNDVWVGAGVFIRDGVTIGDGAVIGAGSVVTRDVPAYAIAAGAPARVVRMRFDADVVARLERLQWWRFRMADFGAVPFEDIHAALDAIERLVQGGLAEYAPSPVRLTDCLP